MNFLQSQLVFQDGETLSEKASRHYTGVGLPLPPQKVSVQEFENDRRPCNAPDCLAHISHPCASCGTCWGDRVETERNPKLHCWTNGPDVVVATSAEDASAVFIEVVGDEWKGEWTQLPDGENMTMTEIDTPGHPSETHTYAEWAKLRGRCFLTSTEW